LLRQFSCLAPGFAEEAYKIEKKIKICQPAEEKESKTI
jgi:hypothetical protein